MNEVLKVFGLWFVIAFGVFTRCIVLKWLWQWFVVPLGFAPITLFHALGLSVFFSSFTALKPKDFKGSKPPEDAFTELCTAILGQGAALLIGWVVHLLMNL